MADTYPKFQILEGKTAKDIKNDHLERVQFDFFPRFGPDLRNLLAKSRAKSLEVNA